MLKVLELFSGTGSIGKCCKELGYEVLSLDNELPADINIDIMDWNYKEYPKDSFDIIWASPPCTFYSNLQGCWIGRKKKDGVIFTQEILDEKRLESDLLIERTLEIINYFNPHYWFMENPQTGQLKNRDVVKDLPYYDVDYCMYSDWGYQKRTRIWTNKENFNNLLCDKSGACGNMIIKNNQAIHQERMGTSKTIKDGDKIIRCNTAALRKKYKDYPNLQDNHQSMQHSKVLGNGYEVIDGKKIICNTKEKRDKLKHKKVADGGGDKRGKHKLNVAIDVHTNKPIGNGTNKLDRYRIPPDLIYSLFID